MSVFSEDNLASLRLSQLDVIQKHPISHRLLREVSGVTRLSELKKGTISEVDWLFNSQANNLDDFLSSDNGLLFLKHLRSACTRKISLWLASGTQAQAARVADFLNTDEIFDISREHSGKIDSTRRRIDTLLQIDSNHPEQTRAENAERPWAIHPHALVACIADNWAVLGMNSRNRIKRELIGLDVTHMTPAVAGALETCDIPVTQKSKVLQLATDPKFITYVVVFIYSTLRVLPVTLVKEFHGNLWVLWTLDIGTAIPYTWGILAMLTDPRRSMRLWGTFIAAVTFAAPYVYFAMTGEDYPWYVILVVILLMFGGVALEGAKYFKEKYLISLLEK